jgi:hypothetical protein
LRAKDKMIRIARTLRPIGAQQLWAQGVYALRGLRPPPPSHGPAPELSPGGEPTAFLPGPRHARWLSSDALELIQRQVDFSAGVDWGYSAEGPLWLYHLNQCDHLRDGEISPERRRDLMLDWVRTCSTGAGWDPHPTCLRVLSWGKLLLTPGAVALTPAEARQIHGSMAQQLDGLERNLEFRLQANHLLANLTGLVFGGLLFEGPRADAWLGREGDLRAELARQFDSEGAHEERSPMYHSLLLENLLDLLNLLRVREGRAPRPLAEALVATAERALAALSVWKHPDGEIALLGDSALGIAPPPDALLAYGRALGLQPRGPEVPGLLASAGFARLEAGPFSLVASFGPPSPAHQPGHAHCDALSFELVCAGERVVCDTGVHSYEPGPRRDHARATRSHATLEIAGAEQSEIWAAHRVGGRARTALVTFEPQTSLEATCASWSTPDTLHRRRFSLADGVLEIRDWVEGTPGSARLALPLAPGLEPRLVHDQEGGTETHIRLPGSGHLRVVLPIEANWRIERMPYYPEFGVEADRACLVGEAEVFESGSWRFEFSPRAE